MSEFKVGDRVRVAYESGLHSKVEGTLTEVGEELVSVDLGDEGEIFFLKKSLEPVEPAPKVDVGKLKTGIVVLDNLDWEYHNGTDEGFLKAVEEFCVVGEKLPRGAFMSVKYLRRLLDITDKEG